MKRMVLPLLFSFSLLPALAACLAGDKAVPPNILFVYTDDQAAWTVGASGNPQAHTPNMDRLVREGAYLVNSFVTTPVCSPARASLMTSRYATEYGILDFIPHPGHRLYDPDNIVGLDGESVTFAEVLQDAGYATGLVGKWHLGDWTEVDSREFHPTNHGFDYFMGLTGGGTSPDNPPLEKDGVVREFDGLTTDILTDHAIEYVEANAAAPFLLCLHYRAPHSRWLPVADADWEPYRNLDPAIPNPDYPDLNVKRAKQRMREYLASVSGVDRNLGRLLETLARLGLEKRTIVIFTSDHGYNMGHNGIEHKGNGIWITKTLPPATENIASKYRPNLYDNSLKVPAIVKWPGVVEPGTVIEETTSNLDWYPTIVHMAGADLSKKHAIRGRDLTPLLRGEEVENWDNDFYAEYSMINYCRAYMRSFRTPKWKLVRDFLNPDRQELYDLSTDPAESVNRIQDSSPEAQQAVEGLHQRILDQMKAIGDPLLDELPGQASAASK
jgi:arylsulfatase A-like enzyme